MQVVGFTHKITKKDIGNDKNIPYVYNMYAYTNSY